MVAAARYRGFLFAKLGKLLNEECSMPAGTKVELESMEKQLKLLLDKYNILGGVRLSQVDVAESVWLCHTKKLFFDAEVLVDSLSTVPAECSEPAASPDGCFQNTSITETADTEIKNITVRGFLLMELLFMEGPNLRALYQETELVGIDGPRDELIKMLAEGDDMSENQLKKVFITVIAGSGKTTLARVVYNQLKPQFECRAFLCALGRENGLIDAVFSTMLPQLGVENHINAEESELKHRQLEDKVKQFLQNKRYLLVIDDACNSETFRWLLEILPNNVYGSKIISTIRWSLPLLHDSVYEMKSLGYLDSRKLFLKQFFVCEASFPAPTNVLNEILKMCGGWPSAIISIALLLATRVNATKPWEEMLNSVYSAWKQMASSVDFESDHSLDFSELIQIILLPYGHLSWTQKECLLYLAVHAKNQMIHRTSMGRKWIAAGFISQYVGHSIDKLTSKYFDDLIDRNFIHLVEYGNYLGEEVYEVNYMMHNVLRWLAHEHNFATVFSDGGTSREYTKSLRLSIQCSGSELSVYTSKMRGYISSITIVGPVKFCIDCHFRDLLVLDLDGCKDLDNLAMDHVCRMINLTYLSLKHTQVTEIPPEIGKLQWLHTLDIRQTKISNLPPEIGELQGLNTLDISQTEISNLPPEIGELQGLNTLDISQTEISDLPPEIGKLEALETLDARRTQISCLPREIGQLQNLETLDVRQTQVEELPKELVQLPKLAHLYFGQISSLRGVKLPIGSDQMKSVKVLGTVDSREWSGSAMEEISGLTGVRKLEVVLHDQPADKDQNDKLLSSIGKCKNLEFLVIHGDYNSSDELPVSPYFPLLERLKVAGRFMKVPLWLSQLTTLRQLYVRVCKLDQDDLKILGGLPGLTNLALALICIPRKKEVTIPIRVHSSICTDLPPLEETCPAGFTSLQIFSFDCRVPWISFGQGAMPGLKHLHLKLYACPAGKFPSGITNLHSLEKIILQYSSEYASSGGVTKTVAAVREEASCHRNLIDLSVNGYHEEFLPNTRVDETVAGTEIEEDSNHGNRIELSVDADQEVLDARVDETTTGTETREASNHGNPMELSVDGDHEALLSNSRVDETVTGTEIKECFYVWL